MKNYLLSLAALLPVSISAQKNIDLDRFNFTVQYRSLPQVRLDSTYRTYNVEVEGTKMMNASLKELEPEKSVVLEGWKKLESKGHITISVKLEDLLPEAISVKERTESVKDLRGLVTGTRTTYYEEVVYTFAANASITDYKGVHIGDEAIATRSQRHVYTGPGFPLKALAQGYFLANSVKITNELYRNCVLNSMHYLSELITGNFGFSPVTVNDYMWIVDSRKDPEYSSHRDAFRQMNDLLFTMDANSSIQEIKEKLKPTISYFENIKTTYTSNSKHDRKLRYASYFNLAVLYYYLDDPQSMMKEANGLILNDYDTRDGEAFAESALRLKNLFQQANIYCRHFPIDTEKFSGPFEKSTVITN